MAAMSSASLGLDLEKRVFTFLEEEVATNRFFVRPECCALFHKRAYYSRDRQANIVFDIAIELSLPGSLEPSMLCLIECKNYNHPVPVDDVEEFFAKVQQVAAARAKAIMVASSAFQRGALDFARSKGIGLVRAFPESRFKWVLHRSPASFDMARARSRDGNILNGLSLENYQSDRFDYFCVVRDVLTHSFNDFLIGLVSSAPSDARFLEKIQSHHIKDEGVAYVSCDEIEACCHAVHEQIRYDAGPVSLDAVCEWRRCLEGLSVTTSKVRTTEDMERGILGRIAFKPAEIVVFDDPTSLYRWRFTLAHELGHLLLGHGAYMESECVDTKDVDTEDYRDLESDDIARLEWQANYFASCLLLPRNALITSTIEQARLLDLRDRGHGLIYLDHQPVNTRNYYLLTSALTARFAASRTALKIRLKTIGLLNDASAPVTNFASAYR
jgi:Zn-dependent peptidase ImmA (M78 family)